MASALTDRRSAPAASADSAGPGLGAAALDPPPGPDAALADAPPDSAPVDSPPDGSLAPELLADLDHPNLVLSDGYVGPDRRADGSLARIRRATFSQRRALLTLEAAVVVVVAVVVTSLVMVGPGRHLSATQAGAWTLQHSRAEARAGVPSAAPAGAAPITTAPAPVAPATVPSTTAPAPPPTTPATTPCPASAASLTPAQLGAEALALVRYPWQQIPGYSIQFLPISDVPSAGFYGNTTFTWGKTGGTSVLYVYPGETVERLAGITAFEIAHEVDAAAVEPEGGEAQIENTLNYHPSSWAPNCDCAEQNFLSGWYAAAFSNYWSPGVGDWSQLPLAPPSGATLGEVASWLNPSIP